MGPRQELFVVYSAWLRSRCDLSLKPMDQKFVKLASSARATDLALKNILQCILLIDCAHFVLSLWYGAETRFVRGVKCMAMTQGVI